MCPKSSVIFLIYASWPNERYFFMWNLPFIVKHLMYVVWASGLSSGEGVIFRWQFAQPVLTL